LFKKRKEKKDKLIKKINKIRENAIQKNTQELEKDFENQKYIIKEEYKTIVNIKNSEIEFLKEKISQLKKEIRSSAKIKADYKNKLLQLKSITDKIAFWVDEEFKKQTDFYQFAEYMNSEVQLLKNKEKEL
jgi:hypothetical protein